MTCRNCDAPTTREYCSQVCHDIDQHPAPRDDMETQVSTPTTTFNVDFIMRFEGGDDDLTQEEVIDAFQDGINTGMVWQLQGFYGRTAQSLIEQGYCAMA